MATIEKRGKAYRITVSFGYNDLGEQVRHRMTWTPPEGLSERQIQKELQRQAVLFEEDVKCGLASSAKKFKDASEEYFSHVEAQESLKHRSVYRLKQCSDRVLKQFGHVRLDRITTSMLQKFLDSLVTENLNERTGKPLSPKTQRHYKNYIANVFDYAMKRGYISYNPCIGLECKPLKKKEINTVSVEELQTFLSLFEGENICMNLFFTLALYCGFRTCEILGLEWSDIDFENSVISINRDRLYTKERGIYTDTPKTNQSRRKLKVDVGIIDLLKKQQLNQMKNKLKCGDQWQNTGAVITNELGGYIRTDYPGKWLTKFCNRNKLPHLTPHQLRHMNASLLIMNGADVATVAGALGHSTPSTTLNIYAEFFAAEQAKASEALCQTLRPSVKKDEEKA